MNCVVILQNDLCRHSFPNSVICYLIVVLLATFLCQWYSERREVSKNCQNFGTRTNPIRWSSWLSLRGNFSLHLNKNKPDGVDKTFLRNVERHVPTQCNKPEDYSLTNTGHGSLKTHKA